MAARDREAGHARVRARRGISDGDAAPRRFHGTASTILQRFVAVLRLHLSSRAASSRAAVSTRSLHFSWFVSRTTSTASALPRHNLWFLASYAEFAAKTDSAPPRRYRFAAGVELFSTFGEATGCVLHQGSVFMPA
jgi:hypothetical protein